MRGSSWNLLVGDLHRLLLGLSFRDKSGEELPVDDAFDQWRQRTERIRENRRAIFLIGNGASAAMASHMAGDLAKNGHLHTEVFTDVSLLTAISNDMGYQHVFAEPLRRRAKAGDMLVAISSSGKSPNVLAGVEVAASMGVDVVTLSAMETTNPLRAMGVLNGYVAAPSYGYAETAHAAILHRWMDLVEVI